MENMVNSYRLFIGCYRNEGNRNGGEIIGVGANAPGEVIHTEAMEKAYQTGKAL